MIEKTYFGKHEEHRAYLVDKETFEIWVELVKDVEGISRVRVDDFYPRSKSLLSFTKDNINYEVELCRIENVPYKGLCYCTHSDYHIMRICAEYHQFRAVGTGSRDHNKNREVLAEILQLLDSKYDPNSYGWVEKETNITLAQ